LLISLADDGLVQETGYAKSLKNTVFQVYQNIPPL
jgi:hypothetical protein